RERFVTCAVAPGQRLYRTGDVARYRTDGVIEWFGRTDDQVKVRGFRIGLGEVEAALVDHPAIATAAVRTWPDVSGEQSLAAYFVPAANTVPESAELREFLKRTLPDYMVPASFLCLPALPMTPNGKIDRNALPRSEPGRPSLLFLEPSGEHEQKLAEIW